MNPSIPDQVTVPRLVTTTPYDPFSIEGELLSSIDKLVFALSLIATNIFIFTISTRVKSSLYTYFLSNRDLNFFPMACSMVMSSIGATQFVGVAGFASRSGVTVYAFELNATVALIFLGWVFLPVYIASGSLTTVDYLKKRYGSVRLEMYISGLTIVLIVATKSSVELYAVYKLLQILFVNLNQTVASLLMLTIAVLIPATGGLRSVVYTNSFQAIYFLIGGTMISYFSVNVFQSYLELKEKFYDAWPNTTRAHFSSNSTDKYTTCGIPHATSWHIIRPFNNLELPWPGMLFGITINNIWYWCCDQLIVQTGLGGKNIVHCKYACIMTGYVKILSILFMVLPGLLARIIHTDTVACADPAICQATCGLRTGCSNLAFPSIFLEMVPPNYRGFVLSGVLACSISSLASCLNSGSTIFTINIYRNIRPMASELELVCATKIFLVIMAVVSLLWVNMVEMSSGLYNYAQFMTSLLAPPIMAVYISGMLWTRAKETSAFISLMGGLLLGLIRLIWETTKEPVPCGEDDTSKLPDIIRYFHFLHFSIFLFVLCVVFIVINGIFTDPILMVHLYRLIYWLRHSKMDRVDIAELEAAYSTFASKNYQIQDINLEDLRRELDNEDMLAGQPVVAAETFPPFVSTLCCIDPDTAGNIVSSNELREAGKYKTNIKESASHSRALNIHAFILLLVSAVMWGFFS